MSAPDIPSWEARLSGGWDHWGHRLTTHVHVCIFIFWLYPLKVPKNTLIALSILSAQVSVSK